MKKLLFALCTLCTLCTSFTASHLWAALPVQPAIEPVGDVDHGAYSLQAKTLGDADPDAARAFDNFSIAAPGYNLSDVAWDGIYAEPIPPVPSETDFIITIYGDADGVPDLPSGPVLEWDLDGGLAGESGPDVSVSLRPGDISPATPTTEGGGPSFGYLSSVSGTLGAGDYWISIVANQGFGNAAPIVDPEWQWHLGGGPEDGFYAADLTNDPAGTPAYGFFQAEKDLSFTLRGTVVPEPNGMLLALIGLVSVGLFRRKRS